ncbi:MAG: nitrate reductase cytochrome c-type subunit [Leptospiraceae bacterium]|nr:nitrate reductase cytochrome c-type subunit [Leptospiraceae bacterium]MCP5499860.1 nitrate reductase cytochrome c-type subunit [Leptospiraceae bacterium]
MKILTLLFSFLMLFACKSEKEAKLDSFREKRYTNRAYEGAPPTIPHSVEEWGRENCLSCHEEGKAAREGKLAKVTPHAFQLSCRQCHVPSVSNSQFQKTDFVGYRLTGVLNKVQALSPPYIPHRLQDRKNCIACHLSESSPEILKPAHGLRVNCLQCHVPQR